MNPIIIIPARMGSTRLPGKPLALIHGRPMVVHVMDRAREAGIGPVAVAAAEPEILAAVREAGGTAVLVADDVASGTDRVKLALDQLDPAGRHDVVVTPIADAHEAATESFVKCACAFLGEAEVAPALYFSRTAIPWGAGPLWHHIGVYAYRRAALARFVSLPPSQLELREKLEQLRALEDGMRIAVARVPHGPFGVDTAEDLARARDILKD
ncbi:MAG: 3-deoxy-manno-octulosonate cytidylyltransferase [Alphaproteobacteria bacterium]|nr:3-deoxy-manno-octulosonate cytidylyltransferase [Alphaproteobacteria bacterium]